MHNGCISSDCMFIMQVQEEMKRKCVLWNYITDSKSISYNVCALLHSVPVTSYMYLCIVYLGGSLTQCIESLEQIIS